MSYLVTAGLAMLCALPIVIGLTLIFTITSGAEPWNKNSYRTAGTLHAVTSGLFAALFVVYWIVAKTPANWLGLVISAVFGFISWRYLRKARKR